MTSVQRLGVINGTGDGGSSFAVNLAQSADYTEPLFLDRAKQARGWQKDFANYPLANLDSEGALNSLISGDTDAMFFFCSATDTDGIVGGPPTGRSGRFRLTFTGSATITGFGITDLTMIDANTYEFDCDWNGNKYLLFTPTAYPIKVTLVKTTDIAAHSAGGIFRQEFLDGLPSGGCFRFMDWMLTNNSTIVNWSDYPVPTSQRWNRIPFDVMIALCEAKSATPWFHIPHQATDAFITAAADYVRDNFAGKARWELSNELWNFQFGQAGYFQALATSQWGVSGGTTWLSSAGKRFAQMMQLINTSFTGQTSRVIGVLAGQAGGSGIGSAMLDAPQWLTSEPGSYVAPHTLAKEWAIGPYINWAGGGATTQGNAIKTQLDISHAAAVAYFKTMFTASLVQSKAWIDSHTALAADRNLRLTVYEYNNHYDLNACASSTLYSAGVPVAGALDVFIEATYSQEMADALDELRAYFKAQNGTLMSFYVDMGSASRFGTWGAKTHLGHDSAIWNDLLSWHTANTRWWAQ